MNARGCVCTLPPSHPPPSKGYDASPESLTVSVIYQFSYKGISGREALDAYRIKPDTGKNNPPLAKYRDCPQPYIKPCETKKIKRHLAETRGNKGTNHQRILSIQESNTRQLSLFSSRFCLFQETPPTKNGRQPSC